MRESRFNVVRKTWPRIYDLRTTRLKCFLIDARWKRQGKKFYAKSLDEAKLKAGFLAQERQQRGIEALTFPTELRLMATQAQATLRPWNATIGQAVAYYVAFLEAEQARRSSLLVGECIDRYVAARRLDHSRGELARLSLNEITGRMRQLRAAFGDRHITELNAPTLRAFIDSYPASARTKTNVKLKASKFLSWCVDQGILDQNPATRIKIKCPESEIKTLSLEQCEALLRAAEASGFADVLAFCAIGLFGGCRVGEINQLRWEHVSFETRTIEIRPESTKVRKRRFAPMSDTLIAWLAPLRQESGPVILPQFRKRWLMVLASCGYANGDALGRNVLRHTAVSNMVAHSQDVRAVAHDCGTSEAVIARFYNRPLPKAGADRFLALRALNAG